MNGLIRQLGELVLGSVPTMLLFLCTLAAYRLLVHRPLKRVLKERYARTQGAMEKSAAAIAAVEAKTAEYEARLRAAHAAIFHHRHERLQALREEQERALTEARGAAEERVLTARLGIEDSAEEARLKLDASIDELAALVLRKVIPSGSPQLRGGA